MFADVCDSEQTCLSGLYVWFVKAKPEHFNRLCSVADRVTVDLLKKHHIDLVTNGLGSPGHLNDLCDVVHVNRAVKDDGMYAYGKWPIKYENGNVYTRPPGSEFVKVGSYTSVWRTALELHSSFSDRLSIFAIDGYLKRPPSLPHFETDHSLSPHHRLFMNDIPNAVYNFTTISELLRKAALDTLSTITIEPTEEYNCNDTECQVCVTVPITPNDTICSECKKIICKHCRMHTYKCPFCRKLY